MHLFNVLVAALGLGVGAANAKGCGGSNDKAVTAFRFRFSVSTAVMDSVTVSSWSDGGGPRAKIPTDVPDLVHPYAGREYAGGDRGKIIGTRAYGSGYPYGAQDVSTIRGRPFPHGMWPISWGPGYLGGDEYWGKDLDLIRPGGVVGIMNVFTKDTSKWPNVSSDEVYTMIGDKESLSFMMTDLVRVCHANPASPRKFNPISSTTSATSSPPQPKPENVIQYYRSSSFALSYAGYNNTFALPSSNPTTNHDSLPLPGGIINSAFLRCVNDTIRASLPLPIALPKKERKLSAGAIVGIVFGSIVGVVLLYGLCLLLAVKTDRKKTEPAPPPESTHDPQGTGETGIPLLDSKKEPGPEKGGDADQEHQTKKSGENTKTKGNEKEAENVVYI